MTPAAQTPPLDARLLDAARKASERIGVELGREHARAERWKARALAAEHDLLTQQNVYERQLRRLAARVATLEERRP